MGVGAGAKAGRISRIVNLRVRGIERGFWSRASQEIKLSWGQGSRQHHQEVDQGLLLRAQELPCIELIVVVPSNRDKVLDLDFGTSSPTNQPQSRFCRNGRWRLGRAFQSQGNWPWPWLVFRLHLVSCTCSLVLAGVVTCASRRRRRRRREIHSAVSANKAAWRSRFANKAVSWSRHANKKQRQDQDHLHPNPDLLRRQQCRREAFRRETTSSNLQGFGSNIFSKISDALFGVLQKVWQKRLILAVMVSKWSLFCIDGKLYQNFFECPAS